MHIVVKRPKTTLDPDKKYYIFCYPSCSEVPIFYELKKAELSRMEYTWIYELIVIDNITMYMKSPIYPVLCAFTEEEVSRIRKYIQCLTYDRGLQMAKLDIKKDFIFTRSEFINYFNRSINHYKPYLKQRLNHFITKNILKLKESVYIK